MEVLSFCDGRPKTRIMFASNVNMILLNPVLSYLRRANLIYGTGRTEKGEEALKTWKHLKELLTVSIGEDVLR